MLRRWIDRRPLALSVVVGLVALLGATRPDRSPPLFAAGLLGNREVVVSVPEEQETSTAIAIASAPGGIRTHTVWILSPLPAADWATGTDMPGRTAT